MALTSIRANQRNFPRAPISWGKNLEEWIRKVAEIVNLLQDGKINAVGSQTLTADTGTTTLSDPRIGTDTIVELTPTTANAATAFATTYQTYPNTTAGQAVINHANNAQTDRTFAYSLQG
tara:strand:+ start:225 stop:584 length:360 start_codon:yes stop_codon:yes gene_type:complete